jgi:hypothetical protein
MDAFRPSLADKVGAAGTFIRERLIELRRRQLVDVLPSGHDAYPLAMGGYCYA